MQDVQQRDEMLFRRLGSLIVEKDIEDQLEEGEIDEHEEMRKVDEICDLLRFTNLGLGWMSWFRRLGRRS